MATQPPIHIHYHSETFTADLSGIRRALDHLLERTESMSQFSDKILREVRETRGVVDSAIAAFSRIAEEIRTNLDDREALSAVADELDAMQGDLADGIASIPSEPTSPPEEPPAVPE
jgi:methyl-accepting chemotaxis protein